MESSLRRALALVAIGLLYLCLPLVYVLDIPDAICRRRTRSGKR